MVRNEVRNKVKENVGDRKLILPTHVFFCIILSESGVSITAVKEVEF